MGVDKDLEHLENAIINAKKYNVPSRLVETPDFPDAGEINFLCRDARYLPEIPDKTVTLITALACYWPNSVGYWREIYKEMNRILYPEGSMIISTEQCVDSADIHNQLDVHVAAEFRLDYIADRRVFLCKRPSTRS